MSNFVILPLIMTMFSGIVLLFFKDKIRVQRWISSLSLLLTVVASFYLVHLVHTKGILTHELGNWKPPFGIVLVADMLSALLVATTSIIALCAVLFAFRSIGEARERFYFYPFVHFLITGVFGAFLTGDLFNLFVFFEVMLMSSYVLIILGGTKIQLKESIKYILVNVVSSALFVISVAYLYAVTGTLNMADLALRITAAGDQGIITVIAMLLLVVFGLKGGIFPLYFWLPGSYKAPPPVISALFGALLTKVGLYAIFRVFTLIFIHDQAFTHPIIGYLAILTIIVGTIGAVAYHDIEKIVIYNIIVAVGVILYGLTIGSVDGFTGSIYYLVHDMIIKGALFLLCGAVISVTGTADMRKMGGLIKRHPLMGWLFFLSILSLAGIPPLSGFIGKLMLVRSGLQSHSYVFVGVMLLSSLLVLYSAMKIFMTCFWGEQVLDSSQEKGSTKGLLLPISILVGLSVVLGIGTEWALPYITEAAKTLADPMSYIQSVLKE